MEAGRSFEMLDRSFDVRCEKLENRRLNNAVQT